MNDVCTYQIRVRGRVRAEDIAPFCPPGLAAECKECESTLLTFRTDQSGLVGLIRHLHGLGLVLLEMRLLE